MIMIIIIHDLAREIERQSASIDDAILEDLGSKADMYIFNQNDLQDEAIALIQRCVDIFILL